MQNRENRASPQCRPIPIQTAYNRNIAGLTAEDCSVAVLDNRHRFPNPHWFEDYSVDFTNAGHHAAYVNGETVVMLPEGEVYMEISKGFEIKPVRCRRTIQADTDTITITLDHLLPWRFKGWVTADTHVHFLSPQSALLEGVPKG